MKSKRCTNCKHFEKTNVKNCGICTCSERKHPLVGHNPKRYNIVGCTGGRKCAHYSENKTKNNK